MKASQHEDTLKYINLNVISQHVTDKEEGWIIYKQGKKQNKHTKWQGKH